MNKFFIILPVLMLVFVAYAQEKLSHISGVAYEYLSDDGAVVTGSKFKDPECKYLTDGKSGQKESAQTQWQNGTDKRMRVRFNFPVPVSPTKVRVGWSWAFGQPKQWIDEVLVFSGKGAKLGSVTLNGVAKENNVWIDVPLEVKERTSTCTVEVCQKADVAHYFFGVGEIIIEGTDYDASLIKEYSVSNAEIKIKHKVPLNHFESNAAIELPISIKNNQDGDGTITWQFKDIDGAIAEMGKMPMTVKDGQGEAVIKIQPLPNGYYDVHCTADITSAKDSGTRHFDGMTSIVVLPTVERTAAEALEKNPRFGIQSSVMSEEFHSIFSRLGISYRRNLLFFAPQAGKDPDNISWDWLDEKIAKLDNGRENYSFEIKTTPQWLRNPEYKSNDWFLRMPSDLERYGIFISEQISRLPEKYQVFELWNEPWGHYSGEEFAKLTAAMRDAIRRVKPNAKMGPNLGPMAQLSNYLDANGMDGMDYLTIHPYSPDFRSSPEASGLRENIQAYRKLLKEKTGRDIPIRVTEIGWPTTPEGKTNNSELRQAQFTTRAVITLTALDVELIIPWCAWQTEARPNDMECWFGMIRKNLTPKPVFAAYATAARKLEGVTTLGYLNISPDIYAPLFRKRDNSLMAAIWADGKEVPFFLNTGCNKVTLTTLTGRENSIETPFGRFAATATDSAIYLEGLGEEILGICRQEAPKTEVKKRPERTAPLLTDEKQWEKIPALTVSAGKDATLKCKLAHDGTALLLNVDVADPNPGVTRFEPVQSWRGDCLELFVSGAPVKIIPGFTGENDYQILVSPFGQDNKEIFICCDDNHRGKTLPEATAKWTVHENGYKGLIRIPLAAIGAKADATEIAFDIALDDVCKTHGRAQGISNGREDNNVNAALWTILKLQR